MPESKAKSGFFPTVEISERGKRQIRKIPHFLQIKISNPQRYIYIYGKISLPESKAKSGFFPTVEISERGKRQIRKIPHFLQIKIS
ncbi:MAG: hypothetical protein AAGJ08_24920, partial [Cyanobacteria bacterium P01_H01_bin.35]